jgi:hypothetical protein
MNKRAEIVVILVVGSRPGIYPFVASNATGLPVNLEANAFP